MMDDPPPSYSEVGASATTAQNNTIHSDFKTTPNCNPPSQAQSCTSDLIRVPSPSSDLIPIISQTLDHPPQYSLFPKQFGFYHISTLETHYNIAIALHAHDPIIFWISAERTSKNRNGQPSITLHGGLSSTSPPLAKAEFHDLFLRPSTPIDISLYSPSSTNPSHYALSPSKDNYHFCFPLPSAPSRPELFKWIPSSGPEVASLRGSKRQDGMKLVRVSTGEAVAAWSLPRNEGEKKGKMALLARDRAELGEEWEGMAVMSALAIREKKRRMWKAENGDAGRRGCCCCCCCCR